MSHYYQKLTAHYSKIHHFNHLAAISSWDQACNMPSGGNSARSNAMAELYLHIHSLNTAPELGEWFSMLKEQDLDPQQKANLQEMRRAWLQARVLPAELVQAKSLAGSRCEHQWRQQRMNNDWQGFSKNLQEVVALSREEAQVRAEANDCGAYDALIELYEPGMNSQKLDQLFASIKAWLPELIVQVVEKQSSQKPVPLEGPFAIDAQKRLAEQVMGILGFDFERGRLDISAHPFCGGVAEDVRITTRYNEADFMQSLMGVIHETGHARYEQGLPATWQGQPVGLARSMGMHESQSLFFEMQVGRSLAFLKLIQPLIVKAFAREHDPAFNVANLHRIYTQVKADYIRVDADEVTYPAHIMLRYEIEKALIENEIEVSDIPELWDHKMQEYLGISTKDNYKDGCMQDIHWTDGSFGYFPSYTLGAIYAAQLQHKLSSEFKNIDSKIEHNDLGDIFNWLKSKVWQKASLLTCDEILISATGEALNSAYFKAHLENRYL